MCPPKFEIFFNISLFPNILSRRPFGNSWGNSYTKFAIPDIKFTCGESDLYLKYCKVPKYCGQDCLKIFFLLSTLRMMIQISAKSVHLAQKCYFYQKTTNEQSWKLFKVNFLLKSNMQNSAYTELLNLKL